MVSAFPPRYTQAMMVGQALAGLTVSLSGLFTTLAGPDDQSCIVDLVKDTAISLETISSGADGWQAPDDSPLSSCSAYTRDWSTLVYFGVAAVLLLGCKLTYPHLARLPLTTYYCGGEVAVVDNGGVESTEKGDMDRASSTGRWLGTGRPTAVSSPAVGPKESSMYRRVVESPPLRLLSLDKLLSDATAYDEVEVRGGQQADRLVAVSSIETTSGVGGIRSRLTPISRYAFTVFVSSVITLSVFPGATSEIVSSRKCEPGRSRFFAGDVFVMFSFVSFNAFDVLGRVAAGLSLGLPDRWLPTAAVSRLMFVPLFLACSSENSRFPNWLSADVFPLVLMPLFSFTNGYLCSVSMMAGSQKGGWAGTAMVLFLNAGLVAGSLLSFVVLFATAES